MAENMRKTQTPPLTHALCAWCKKVVRKPGKGGKAVEVALSETGYTVEDFAAGGSHGICKACSRKELAQYKKQTKTNPSTAEWQAIIDLFETFHGFDPDTVSLINVKSAKIPKMLMYVGTLEELTYKSDKFDNRKRLYLHKFGNTKPVLAAGPDGRLYIVGGDYVITEKGIEG